MRLTDAGLDSYLASIAKVLDQYGLGLELADRDLTIEQTDDGARTFDLRAFLPEPARAIVDIRETWLADGTGAFERVEYVYELLDRGRDFRRAFHLHFPDWFERRFLVVVHEHCERPIGEVECEHYEGVPIRDAFAGVLALMDIWASDPPDCSALRCLE